MRAIVVLILCSCYLCISKAYPSYFYNPREGYIHKTSSCEAHPERSYDAEGSIHGKPQLDSLISFTLAGVDGAAAAAFCPGAAHRLAVNFTDARLAMLTSGRDVSFGQQHAAGACPNRADLGGSRSGGAATGFVVPFRVACSASGDLTFRVTSASRRLPNAWKHNSVTLPVSAACAAAECTVEL